MLSSSTNVMLKVINKMETFEVEYLLEMTAHFVFDRFKFRTQNKILKFTEQQPTLTLLLSGKIELN